MELDSFIVTEENLPSSIKEKARVELNETEETRRSAMAELRELLPPELAGKVEELVLLSFLRVAKFDADKAKTRVLAYDKYRREHADMFADMTLEDVLPVFESGVLVVPKSRDSEGRLVLLFNYTHWDTSKMGLADIQRAMSYLVEVYRDDHMTQIAGSTSVYNLYDYSFSHFAQFSPSLLSRALASLHCMPHRVSRVMFCNEPFYYNLLWKMSKPLLSAKMRDRVSFHRSDFSAAHKLVGKENLPKAFGGTACEAEQIAAFVDFLKSFGPLREW